jgi:hypothetical protein
VLPVAAVETAATDRAAAVVAAHLNSGAMARVGLWPPAVAAVAECNRNRITADTAAVRSAATALAAEGSVRTAPLPARPTAMGRPVTPQMAEATGGRVERQAIGAAVEAAAAMPAEAAGRAVDREPVAEGGPLC